MMDKDSVKKIAEYSKSVLRLETANLGSEYGYDCLPLCIIDAVWSIGVRYGGVKNVVNRYKNHFGLEDKSIREKHSLCEMLDAIQTRGISNFSQDVFQNTQRTSTCNGILKSEAVLLFASILHRHGIDKNEDVPKIVWYQDLYEEMKKPYAREILALPGQKSGISLSYFYMLTGSSGIVKPDRMVNGFLKNALEVEGEVTIEEAQYLLSYASRYLIEEFPQITPRSLDHEIWKYQSGRGQ